MDTFEPFRSQAPLRARYDAIVIGTGMGGATAALRLGLKGLNVLLVERGDFMRPHPADSDDRRSIYMSEAVPAGADINLVGGKTKFYGAALYRMRESDFRAVEHEAGISPAWPLRYDDLEPYYADAEAIYKVHGSGENDPSDPPRRSPYPHPPVPYDPLVETLASNLKKRGAQVAPVPRGVDFGPGGGCVNCAFCDTHFCARGAKMDAEMAAVRPALRLGNVQLSTLTACTRVLLDDAQERAIGVALMIDGREQSVYCDAVVVAAGHKGSVELLRRSRTARHPHGLGNDTGNLGRNLAGHSTGMLFPFMGVRRLPPVQTKSFAINTYYEAGLHSSYPLGVIQLAGQMPFWRGASALIRPVAKLLSEHCFTAFYMTEAAPTFEAGFLFDGDAIVGQTEPKHSLASFHTLRGYAVSLFQNAGYPTLARRRAPYLWHEVGTTRMGEDRKASVVDPNGEVHAIGGLFIADAGVMVTAGAVNTGLTIAALALRIADHIALGAARRTPARAHQSAPT